MFKLIHLPTLIIFLALGLFVNYVVAPPLDIIYVYPTPDNIGSIQFKDKSDTCYGFRSKEVACPKNQTKIRHYPVQ